MFRCGQKRGTANHEGNPTRVFWLGGHASVPMGTSFYKSHAGHRPCSSEEAPAWLRNGRRCRPIYIDRAARRVSVYCAWPPLILPRAPVLFSVRAAKSHLPFASALQTVRGIPPGRPNNNRPREPAQAPRRRGECEYTLPCNGIGIRPRALAA